tara:strand:+ start:205 stop:381 length:177 start_codon:yes stop_codon:yes gene_type:complete
MQYGVHRSNGPETPEGSHELLGVQTMICWCRKVKCVQIQRELKKVQEVIEEVEALVVE